MQPVKWPASVAPALDTTMKKYQGLDNQHINGGGGGLYQAIANPLTARMHKGINTTCDEGQTLIPTNGGGFDVAHSLRGDGFDASEDGTGRGTPLVPIQNALRGKSQNGLGIGEGGEPMYTLDKASQHAIAFPINTQIAMRHEAMGESTGMGIGEASDPAFTLQSAHSHAVAFTQDDQFGGANQNEVSPTLSKSGLSGTMGGAGAEVLQICAPSLTAYNMDSRSPQSEEQQRIVGAVYKSSMQVRRLTPMECERLQGFPDNYTLVQHRNKPAADGPRYKALGNSMAVPVMAWIGRRIAMVEQLKGDSRDD